MNTGTSHLWRELRPRKEWVSGLNPGAAGWWCVCREFRFLQSRFSGCGASRVNRARRFVWVTRCRRIRRWV